MHYRFQTTPEYRDWLEGETKKSQAQIADRLEKIETEGHFGIHKCVGNFVWGLKWARQRHQRGKKNSQQAHPN